MKQAFFVNNRQNIHSHLSDDSVLVLFAGTAPHKSADAHYPFTPNRNFLYLTGVDREHAVLLVSKRNGTVTETLFIEKADPVAEKWTGKKMTPEEAREKSGIQNIEFLEDFEKKLAALLSNGAYQNLYLDLEQRDWNGAPSKAHTFAKQMTERYPYLAIRNIYPVICEMRTTKTPEEVERIREAIDITKRGIENMLAHARPEMMEYELQAHFDFVLLANGVQEHAFRSIIASGQNATILHYEENNQRVRDNDLVLIDLGAQVEYYNADISRTFPVNGKFTDRQKELYEIVLKAELETIRIIKPGLPFEELNKTTRRVLTEELKRIGLIENEEQLSQYYYHNVSHHLGLDTHDVGERTGIVLKPGMVLTVEPGLYVAEESIGIRIEDNVLVTEDGCEVLSKDIIKTVEEIEAFMANNRK
jgi:Xaa-Pro aminopeptidase